MISILEHHERVALLLSTTAYAPSRAIAIVGVEEGALDLEQRSLVDELLGFGVDGGGVEDCRGG